MILVTVNYTAVLAAAIASMVIGFLWYSPMLFGTMWMELIGTTKEKMEESKKKMGPLYAGIFVAALATAYVLAHFAAYAQANTIMLGMQTGFWAWLGFVATTMLGNVIFAGKPFKLYLLDVGYHLVSLVVMGAIVAGWM